MGATRGGEYTGSGGGVGLEEMFMDWSKEAGQIVGLLVLHGGHLAGGGLGGRHRPEGLPHCGRSAITAITSWTDVHVHSAGFPENTGGGVGDWGVVGACWAVVVHEREEHVLAGQEPLAKGRSGVGGCKTESTEDERSGRRAVKALLALAGDGGGLQPSWR